VSRGINEQRTERKDIYGGPIQRPPSSTSVAAAGTGFSPGGGQTHVLNQIASRIAAKRASTSASGQKEQHAPARESDSHTTTLADEAVSTGEREAHLDPDDSTPFPSDLDGVDMQQKRDPGAPVDAEAPPHPATRAPTRLRTALVASTLIVAALGGLAGFVGYGAYEARVAAHQRDLFLQVGHQAAVNLTTINYTEADADVARVLDSATGAFHDDFQKRSQPFIDVVKQAQSTSQGSVTAAGLESVEDNQAQVIVAVSVKTSNAGASDQQPRGWRMRLVVQRVGSTAKVSDVQFIP